MKKFLSMLFASLMIFSVAVAAAPSPSVEYAKIVKIASIEEDMMAEYGAIKVVCIKAEKKVVRTFITVPHDECYIVVIDKFGNVLNYDGEYNPETKRHRIVIKNPNELEFVYGLVMEIEIQEEKEKEN